MGGDHIVIVGAGQGGLQAAISLRQQGHSGAVTLIGDEPGLPYQRPPLSKAFLKEGDAGKLVLRPQAFLEDQQIDYRPGLRVQAIDRAAARLDLDGASLPYDHLILATGTRTAPLPVPGAERCMPLRSMADAARLRDAMAAAQRIVVIGGGFIGLEFAAVAAGLGKAVTVLEAADRLMARALSPAMSERFLAKHRALGVEVALTQRAAEITPQSVVLQDGSQRAADLVLAATGVVPNLELAQAAGLATGNGVIVDDRLLTADRAISALGDVACFPDARRGGAPTRIESVQAATDHARHIARRLCAGDSAAYTALPWFWSDQADWKLQIAGLATPDAVVATAESGAHFLFDQERLVAVETINDARTHMLARRWMSDPAAVVDRAFLHEAGVAL